MIQYALNESCDIVYIVDGRFPLALLSLVARFHNGIRCLNATTSTCIIYINTLYYYTIHTVNTI